MGIFNKKKYTFRWFFHFCIILFFEILKPFQSLLFKVMICLLNSIIYSIIYTIKQLETNVSKVAL